MLSVVVGTDPHGPAWRAVAPGDPSARAPEAYYLEIGGTPDAPTATVAGSDAAGAFYGVTTLLELVDSDADGNRQVPQTHIQDHPDLAWRGTIEGFYGTPWSHADRLAHLDFAGRHKLNTYVYAPKDDPHHRHQWREPYSDDELERLGELVDRAQRRHVRFVFSISPGLSMVYSDPAEIDLLAHKLVQVSKVGVRDFALLFDDIPPELSHDADVDAFGSAAGSSARAHAAVCRQIRDRFVSMRDSDHPLIMVPTDYAGTQRSDYRDHLARELPSDVLVWWTGRDIVVGDVTRQHIDAAAATYQHRLLLWDNFPVNDFDFSRLFLGPLTGRETGVAGSALVGITANPMPHEAASQIAVATVADWAWNLSAYDPESAHARAIRSVEGASSIRTLIDSCRTWPPSAPRAPQLSAWIDTLTSDDVTTDARSAALAGLRETFTAMVDEAPTQPTGRLERAVEPWLRAQAATGRAGLSALAFLDSALDNAADVDDARDIARHALVEAEGYEPNVLRDVVLPFVRQVINVR